MSKQVKFEQLDFKLFIAGELEIISEEDLTKSELEGRLSLLKKIVYYSSTYEFESLTKVYASWVREIEVGRKKWSDDPSSWESAFLSKYVIKSNKQFTPGRKENVSNNDERVWFCSAYQRNKCAYKSNHMLVIKGKMRLASHICASCWQKDKKKLEHPESSSCCPHASVWLKSGITSEYFLKVISESKNQKSVDMFFPKFCHPNVEDNSIESHAESKSVITSHLCKHSEKCEICKVTKKHVSLSLVEFLLDVHNKVRLSGKYNFEGCRIRINYRMNIEFLRSMLSDYKDKQICEFLEFGFPIGYKSENSVLKDCQT